MTIDLTPTAKKLVERLLATGLYGQTEADVCERLFYERLQQIAAAIRATDRGDNRPPNWEPQIK